MNGNVARLSGGDRCLEARALSGYFDDWLIDRFGTLVGVGVSRYGGTVGGLELPSGDLDLRGPSGIGAGLDHESVPGGIGTVAIEDILCGCAGGVETASAYGDLSGFHVHGGGSGDDSAADAQLACGQVDRDFGVAADVRPVEDVDDRFGEIASVRGYGALTDAFDGTVDVQNRRLAACLAVRSVSPYDCSEISGALHHETGSDGGDCGIVCVEASGDLTVIDRDGASVDGEPGRQGLATEVDGHVLADGESVSSDILEKGEGRPRGRIGNRVSQGVVV